MVVCGSMGSKLKSAQCVGCRCCPQSSIHHPRFVHSNEGVRGSCEKTPSRTSIQTGGGGEESRVTPASAAVMASSWEQLPQLSVAPHPRGGAQPHVGPSCRRWRVKPWRCQYPWQHLIRQASPTQQGVSPLDRQVHPPSSGHLSDLL